VQWYLNSEWLSRLWKQPQCELYCYEIKPPCKIYRFFLICSNFNCILLPNYIPNITIFSVSWVQQSLENVLPLVAMSWNSSNQDSVLNRGQCPFSEHLHNMDTLLHSENCCVLCQQVVLLGLFFQWYCDCWSLSPCPPRSISSATPRDRFEFSGKHFFQHDRA
jgi:hypothetical protein